MKSRLKCGVVGVGYLGQHHARIYSSLEECSLVGICDIDPRRAVEIASKYHCEVFDSIEELGNWCECVSVVTPTDKHAETAIPLIEKNCHLLIEKPLTSSTEDAERILKAASSRNRILQMGLIEHYNPVMKFLETSVVDPQFVTSQRLAPFNTRGTEVGVVLDLMIHDIGIILRLVKSEIVSIDAIGIRVLSKTEDIANARLRFANGCVADLNVSRVSEKKLREIRIFQPQAYLSMDFTSQSGHLMKVIPEGLTKNEIPIEKEEPLRTEILSFIQCVQNHTKPKTDIHFGKKTLELALKITEIICLSTDKAILTQ
ncbi:MAG: Gfo/Idh/MocA family oxidoreductase [Puniceicoccales bacterium]|jgi:predicted dehydrogenase|nr:Gfo/Idh/MocA family oxidoreductase [Puniceicoccales bacterium]